jgi:hypothetical protein
MQVEPPALGAFGSPGSALPTARQTAFLSWMTDVLIYVVVINLFVEYLPTVVIESFTISVLTAARFRAVVISAEAGNQAGPGDLPPGT